MKTNRPMTYWKMVKEDEFNAFLKKNPLAIPDGFKTVGSFIQTKWMIGDKEVARESVDGFGTIYELVD